MTTGDGPGRPAATRREPGAGAVVAVVAAFERADTVGPTVAALHAAGGVDRVIVVDDGSRDGTAAAAAGAGADVLRLARNRGKGGALSAGIGAAPDARAYLLVDGDLGSSATAAVRLLAPVLSGEAGMAVAVLPPAGPSGGLGSVRRLAAWGVGRAAGWRPRAPLSGQRAVDGALLRALLPLAPGFGVETALGIDAVRAGARVAEIELPLAHRPTGRGVGGFAHRGRQGGAVVRALAGRLGERWSRLGAGLGVGAMAVAALAGLSVWLAPPAESIGSHPARVLIFGIPGLGWDDVTARQTPALLRLVSQGAAGSVVAGTGAGAGDAGSHLADAYATLGAGAPARAGPALPEAASLGGAELVRESGRAEPGDVAVVHAPGGQRASATASRRRWVVTAAAPGSLGEALHRAGLRTGAVGAPGAALAVMDGSGWVDAASLAPQAPVVPGGPVSITPVDGAGFTAEVGAALDRASVVVADPGLLERATALAAPAAPGAAAALRRRALVATDQALAAVVDAGTRTGRATVVVVVALRAGSTPGPVVVAGPGVGHGRLERAGPGPGRQLTVADVTATVARLAGARFPGPVTGLPLGVTRAPASGDRAHLAGLRRSAHLVAAGSGVDDVAAPLLAAALGLLALAAAVWLVRERGWPERPIAGPPRPAPSAPARAMGAAALVAGALPVLVLAQASLARAVLGPRSGAGFASAAAGLMVVIALALVVGRVGRLELRRAVRAAGWLALGGGALVLALARAGGPWGLVVPGSALIGGAPGAGAVAAAAVIGGALVVCATGGGARVAAGAALVAAAVLALPALGNDPLGAAIAVVAGAVAVSGHLGGRGARRALWCAAPLLAALVVGAGLLQRAMAATAVRTVGADVFGWRSPWLVPAAVALGAVVAVATVVVPGPSPVDSTAIRPQTQTAFDPEVRSRGPERAGGWALLLAGVLAVALHRDGMATGALLLAQLAALAVLVAVRAGDPEPQLTTAGLHPQWGRTPVSA